MRTPSPIQLLPFLLLVSAFLALGCSDSDSPTGPDGPLLFSGQIEFQGNSSHDFNMPDDGVVNITLVDIRVVLFDRIQADPDNVVLGFGIGQRDANTDNCALTANFGLQEGNLNVFRLARDDYCMSIFDAGSLPEDAVIAYTLEAKFSF